jgi:hypothetical protein
MHLAIAIRAFKQKSDNHNILIFSNRKFLLSKLKNQDQVAEKMITTFDNEPSTHDGSLTSFSIFHADRRGGQGRGESSESPYDPKTTPLFSGCICEAIRSP